MNTDIEVLVEMAKTLGVSNFVSCSKRQLIKKLRAIPQRVLIDENQQQQYITGLPISQGAYGIVYSCVSHPDAVIKLELDGKSSLGKEIVIYLEIADLNIAPKMLGYGRCNELRFIVLEKFEKTFLSVTQHLFSPSSKFLRKIIECLHLLHSKNISHGDVKNDNILIDETRVKLIDFGKSRIDCSNELKLQDLIDFAQMIFETCLTKITKQEIVEFQKATDLFVLDPFNVIVKQKDVVLKKYIEWFDERFETWTRQKLILDQETLEKIHQFMIQLFSDEEIDYDALISIF